MVNECVGPDGRCRLGAPPTKTVSHACQVRHARTPAMGVSKLCRACYVLSHSPAAFLPFALSANNPLACFRSCDPDNFQDPADLRALPVPEEIDEEYLIYALFEREDRPDGAFLSKRWCSLEDILEHTHPGLMLTKIKEWNQGRAARESAAVSALFSQAEAELDGAGAEAMQEEGAGGARGPEAD